MRPASGSTSTRKRSQRVASTRGTLTSQAISGVIPRLAAIGDAALVRTENGIGALISWAGRLWYVTYASGRRGTGAGAGVPPSDRYRATAYLIHT